EFESHLKTAHNRGPLNKFGCQYCDKRFPSTALVVRHAKTHSKGRTLPKYIPNSAVPTKIIPQAPSSPRNKKFIAKCKRNPRYGASSDLGSSENMPGSTKETVQSLKSKSTKKVPEIKTKMLKNSCAESPASAH